jgi:hypothetical protein
MGPRGTIWRKKTKGKKSRETVPLTIPVLRQEQNNFFDVSYSTIFDPQSPPISHRRTSRQCRTLRYIFSKTSSWGSKETHTVHQSLIIQIFFSVLIFVVCTVRYFSHEWRCLWESFNVINYRHLFTVKSSVLKCITKMLFYSITVILK